MCFDPSIPPNTSLRDETMNTSTRILTAVCGLAFAGSALGGTAFARGSGGSSTRYSGNSTRSSNSYANVSQGAYNGTVQHNLRSNSIYTPGNQLNSNSGRFQNLRSSRNDFVPKNSFWKSYSNWSDGPAKYMGGSPPSRAPKGTPENPSGHHDWWCWNEGHHHRDRDSDKNPIVNTIHPIVNKNPIDNTIHPIVNSNPTPASGATSLNGTVRHLPISAVQVKPNNTLAPGLYSNGFVWTGTHWERPRAGNGYYGNPLPGHPIPGGPAIPVRDHRNGLSPEGGSSVSGNRDVTGVGASPIDKGVSAVVNGVSSVINFFNPVQPDPLYQPPHFTDHRHP